MLLASGHVVACSNGAVVQQQISALTLFSSPKVHVRQFIWKRSWYIEVDRVVCMKCISRWKVSWLQKIGPTICHWKRCGPGVFLSQSSLCRQNNSLWNLKTIWLDQPQSIWARVVATFLMFLKYTSSEPVTCKRINMFCFVEIILNPRMKRRDERIEDKHEYLRAHSCKWK